ncbi:hypothetical protein ACLB2K_026206 [Fragaria x ananassa]
MPTGTIPPGAPPLIIRSPTIDSSSTGSPLASTTAPDSTRRIKAEDIVQQTGQKVKLEYCPCVKGPSVRGINSLVAYDIGCAIQILVGMRARTFYDLDQTEKWKVWNAMSPKYKWDENDDLMFNWILKRAQERYKGWKYQCHKTYLKEWPSGMPSDFIGREDQWEFLCKHFESDAFKRLSLANKRNRGEKTMHHHTGSSPIIYTIEELRIQGEQLPIIKGFEKTYVREGDEVTTKYYVSVSPFIIIRPPRVDKQQLQEVQERYEQRLKESEQRAQQQIQEFKQHVLRAESMYSDVQSQVAAIYEHLGMSPPPPPQVSP